MSNTFFQFVAAVLAAGIPVAADPVGRYVSGYYRGVDLYCSMAVGAHIARVTVSDETGLLNEKPVSEVEVDEFLRELADHWQLTLAA